MLGIGTFWDNLIEPLFGYIALALVFGTMLIVIYVLIVVTFLIRKLIAPEFDMPKVSGQAHKWFWIGVGIVFLAAIAMFTTAFIPAVLALYSVYLFLRHVFPILVKKMLF